jgi:hypothetical protein
LDGLSLLSLVHVWAECKHAAHKQQHDAARNPKLIAALNDEGMSGK